MAKRIIKTPDGEYVMEFVAPGPLEYLGDQRITATGAATLPAGCDLVAITCEAGTVRYRLNATAGATTGCLVALGATEYLPALTNLESLHVYIADSGAAYLKFFQSLELYTGA